MAGDVVVVVRVDVVGGRVNVVGERVNVVGDRVVLVGEMRRTCRIPPTREKFVGTERPNARDPLDPEKHQGKPRSGPREQGGTTYRARKCFWMCNARRRAPLAFVGESRGLQPRLHICGGHADGNQGGRA